MFPTNSERLIGISDAFSAFVYGYPSSCPRAHCTPNKSVPTLRYTRRHGPVYTGHACRHLPSAVPCISEDRLLRLNLTVLCCPVTVVVLPYQRKGSERRSTLLSSRSHALSSETTCYYLGHSLWTIGLQGPLLTLRLWQRTTHFGRTCNQRHRNGGVA